MRRKKNFRSFLMEACSDINVKNEFGQTPLHFVCEYQNKNTLETIKYLIEKGADINAKTKGNQTLLHYVCQFQKNEKALEIIKYLIEKGLEINVTNSFNETPLSLACQHQKQKKGVEVIKYLMKKGGNINTQNYDKETPLHYVCKYQKQIAFEIIKYLIKKEDILKIANLLIENGADINIRNDSNGLPLNYAIQNKNQELIKLLIMNESNIPDSDTYEITKEIIDLFLKIYSINQDLNNLLNSNDNLSDFEIKTNDLFKFKVHKQILLLRFDYNQTNLQKFINNCLQKPKEIVEIAINFIYTGFPNFDNFIQRLQILKNYLIKIDELKKNSSHQRFYQEKEKLKKELRKEEEEEELKTKETKRNEIIEEFFKEIGFDSNWIKSKSKRKGIIKDLSKLYKENDSKKDFTIICSEEKEIKVHKLILFLRSELFKGMFQLNIQDKSNQVHDYSRKSFETIQQFIYFLYHDKIEENKFNSKIIEEFEDIKDYFQLNLNSIIDLILNDLISSNKFKNTKKRK
ncbi:ankyrin repeat [Anaeramoeba ignava]|uniref:Ankyrin repeat n=1 Tax=Anaeramoeba ignava TaxID=1746090 RepID=A0A9Q0LH25_ANAIG|nr:ankyrin repeat [Anaeramoeba ignava]